MTDSGCKEIGQDRDKKTSLRPDYFSPGPVVFPVALFGPISVSAVHHHSLL